MNNIAVIDLGTNTFHLLIVTIQNGEFTEIYRHRRFVNLAENGISKIGEGAYIRAIESMKFFTQKLIEFKVSKGRIVGTAALRTASNGNELIQDIKRLSGFNVHIIDGQKEAELIFKGVSLLSDFGHQNQLIMDIGGGSVEFIITGDNMLKWKNSYPIGVTVLYNRFHKSDPLHKSDIQAIEKYLSESLSTLETALGAYHCVKLIGASGSFEVLQKMVSGKIYKSRLINYPKEKFNGIYRMLINSSLEERLKMPRLIKERAKLVVVAFILINHILKLTNIESISVSPYALKEGVLAELSNI